MAGTQGTTRAVHRGEWLDAGACRNEDPELFFPITSSGPSAGQIEAAKAVCHRCGVADQCLHYALESHQSYGVWGGTSEEERGHMSPDSVSSDGVSPDGVSTDGVSTDGVSPDGVSPDSGAALGSPASPRPSRRPLNARRPSRRNRSGREGRSNAGFRA